jgi:hypothetical protein
MASRSYGWLCLWKRSRTTNPGTILRGLILASSDQMAIDPLAAKIMGFEPLEIDYIKMAHDRGLGMGDINQIEIVGMDGAELKDLNFKFHTAKSPVIAGIRSSEKTMRIPPFHNALFNYPFFKSFIFASDFYHYHLWFPTTGKKKINAFKETRWGELFQNYPYGEFSDTLKSRNGTLIRTKHRNSY